MRGLSEDRPLEFIHFGIDGMSEFGRFGHADYIRVRGHSGSSPCWTTALLALRDHAGSHRGLPGLIQESITR